jgi:hypothetical protein
MHAHVHTQTHARINCPIVAFLIVFLRKLPGLRPCGIEAGSSCTALRLPWCHDGSSCAALVLEVCSAAFLSYPLGGKAAFHLPSRVLPSQTHVQRSHRPHSPKPFRPPPPSALRKCCPIYHHHALVLSTSSGVTEHKSFSKSKFSSPWSSSPLQSCRSRHSLREVHARGDPGRDGKEQQDRRIWSCPIRYPIRCLR